MAVSKIHALYNTLGKAISYITNPDKTDGGYLVSSFGCSIETAAIEMMLTASQGRNIGNRIGYHMLQSFSPEDNITPEKAHELGKEFADKMLKGKFEYVIATHIDKDHIHNHIIFNATSFYDLNKYHHDNKDTQRMHEINDKICSENDLSVVEKKSVDKKLADKSREKKKYRKGEDISLRAKLKTAIEEAISRSGTFEEFLQIMKLEGFDHAYRGKMLRFQVPSLGNSKGYSMIRLNGKNMYTEEQIRKKIQNQQQSKVNENSENEQQQLQQTTIKSKEKEQLPKTKINQKTSSQYDKPNKKRMNLIVDISKNIKAQESRAYNQALVRSNIDTLVKTMNFLTENNIQNPDDFKNYYAAKSAEYEFIREDIKQLENKQIALSEKIKFTQDYKKYHNLYYAAKRAGSRTKFYMEHESEIVAFEAARLYFTRIGENPDKINLTDLFADYRLIKEDKFVTGLSLKEAGKEINNLDIISKNVDDALGIELVEREKQNQIKENTKKKVNRDVAR